MTSYNLEKYITKSIESVLNQTYKLFELIIVDDCSIDNTIDKIKKIKDKRIKLIQNKKNIGAGLSRNIAINNAKGEYIAFLDGDDIWSNNKLELQIEYMKKKYFFTFTSFTYSNNKNNIVKVPKSLNYKGSLKNTIILTSTVMINVTKINKNLIYMPDIKRGQDTATWWNILKHNNIAYGLNKPLTIYNVRNNSLSSNRIICLKRTWNLYRNVEKLSFLKSIYYFSNYFINAIKKRI